MSCQFVNACGRKREKLARVTPQLRTVGRGRPVDGPSPLDKNTGLNGDEASDEAVPALGYYPALN
jgi:hypothetical protein